MKKQLLKTITDLEHKDPDNLYKYLHCYNDLDYNSYNEVIRGLCRDIRKNTINEIIKIVKETNMPVAKPRKCHWCGE